MKRISTYSFQSLAIFAVIAACTSERPQSNRGILPTPTPQTDDGTLGGPHPADRNPDEGDPPGTTPDGPSTTGPTTSGPTDTGPQSSGGGGPGPAPDPNASPSVTPTTIPMASPTADAGLPTPTVSPEPTVSVSATPDPVASVSPTPGSVIPDTTPTLPPLSPTEDDGGEESLQGTPTPEAQSSVLSDTTITTVSDTFIVDTSGKAEAVNCFIPAGTKVNVFVQAGQSPLTKFNGALDQCKIKFQPIKGCGESMKFGIIFVSDFDEAGKAFCKKQ